MVYVPATSSEALHLQSIDELRFLDFQTFESFVIQRLSKELDLRPSIFRRKCFTIYYTTDEVSGKGYHYCILSNDEQSSGAVVNCIERIFRFLRPGTAFKSVKFENEPKNMFEHDFNIFRHFRAIREFMTREENLRQEGIFLKDGSQEMQEKIIQRMQSSKFLDLDEIGCTVYDCANVLKLYLKHMDEPIFLSNYYPAYERIAKMAMEFEQGENVRRRSLVRTSLATPNSELVLKEQKLIDCLQLITHLVPHRKREIFGHILEIMEGVYNYRSFNRMSASALGAIFTPLIICPRGLPRDVAFSVSREFSFIITKMIRVGREIFGAPLKLRLQVWKYVLHSKYKLDEQRNSVVPTPYY